MTDATLQDLLEELAKVRSLDFRGYKPASLQRRLRKRIAQLNLGGYREYIEYFRDNPGEINHLLSVVLINVTEFFRDPAAWDVLRREALPQVLNRIQRGGTFRAWCAGCATGEEVYSLAMLLAEHFGPHLGEFDVKIYASDHDDEALAVARRGEYEVDRLRRVPPEWQEKYFIGSGSVRRVQRDLRRLAIFGRSNLVSDAPISHVQLLICRNVLIYFDIPLQRQVIDKFRYALEDGGILFLGKSESQLRDLISFHPINTKWRIFQCDKETGAGRREDRIAQQDNRELDAARQLQRYVVDNVRSAVVMLDLGGTVVSQNRPAVQFFAATEKAVGGSIYQSPYAERCPQLVEVWQQAMADVAGESRRFQCKFSINGDERALDMLVRPVLNAEGQRTGCFIICDDISAQERLRTTVEELETTAEELHSANEELETTNEELQSTNEELETTNEELQSTNEELETTNEELHSLNEELETTNEELEQRTRDLEESATRYAETLAHMPIPIAVVNDVAEIQLWNSAAERLFNLAAEGVKGLKLKQLPIVSRLRTTLVRRHEAVLRTLKPALVRDVRVSLDGFAGLVNLRFTPISGSAGKGVLIVFDPQRPNHTGDPARKRPAGKSSGGAVKNKPTDAKKNRRGPGKKH